MKPGLRNMVLALLLLCMGMPCAFAQTSGDGAPRLNNILKVAPLGFVNKIRGQFEHVVDSTYSLGVTGSYYFWGADGETDATATKAEFFGRRYLSKNEPAPDGFYATAAVMGGLHHRTLWLEDPDDFALVRVGRKTYPAFGAGAGLGVTGFAAKERLCFNLELLGQVYKPLKFDEFMSRPRSWEDESTWFSYGEGAVLQLRFMMGYRF